MATPQTVKEFVADLDQMMKDACQETGVDYDEFVVALANALGV